MLTNFKKHIDKFVQVSNDEFDEIQEFFDIKNVAKKENLLEEGQVCRHHYFVLDGLLRKFYINEKGIEQTTEFAIETWWMADYESYNSGNPSKNNIDALEDTELIMIKKNDFDAVVKAIPNFRSLKEKLETRSYDASQNRILSNISDTAEKRYENFIKKYPDIYNRVPLHMIASYLGLTRETLSRIRSNYAKPEK